MNSVRVPASALLIALLLLPAACTSSQTPGASASPSPEGTAGASASPSASPSTAPSESPDEAVQLAWERLEVPTLGENSAVIDVEAAGPGFVALATDGLTGSARRARRLVRAASNPYAREVGPWLSDLTPAVTMVDMKMLNRPA